MKNQNFLLTFSLAFSKVAGRARRAGQYGCRPAVEFLRLPHCTRGTVHSIRTTRLHSQNPYQMSHFYSLDKLVRRGSSCRSAACVMLSSERTSIASSRLACNNEPVSMGVFPCSICLILPSVESELVECVKIGAGIDCNILAASTAFLKLKSSGSRRRCSSKALQEQVQRISHDARSAGRQLCGISCFLQPPAKVFSLRTLQESTGLPLAVLLPRMQQ